MLEVLPLAKLQLWPGNIRRDVGDITELAASIEAVGLLEPLVVTPSEGGGHLILAGARRFAAAKKAGLAEVPCMVREVLTEEARLKIALVENLQREDLTPLEEATGYQRLGELGLNQRTIAEEVGRSQGHISKRLALLELPTDVQAQVVSGGITVADAAELAKLAAHPERIKEAVRFGNIVHGVHRQLEAVKEKERFDQLVTEAKAGKIPYRQASMEGGGLPKGSVELDDYSIGLDAAARRAHRKLDCHAVTVLTDWQGARKAAICIKPANHPTKASRRTARYDREDRKRKEQEKALSTAARARRTFVRELIKTARWSREETDPFLLAELVHASHASVQKAACELLGIQGHKGKGPYASWDYAGPLLAEAEKPKRMLAVAMGVVFAAFEERAGSTWAPERLTVGRYFEWLKGRGYELSAVERARLPKPKKAAPRG